MGARVLQCRRPSAPVLIWTKAKSPLNSTNDQAAAILATDCSTPLFSGETVDWTRGYFAEGGYTYGYYTETSPARLRWASLIQGHVVEGRPLRMLDAGCGQGIGLLVAAALHPESDFVGIDFMPEHIAHARELAHRAGLDNVRFIEADFTELAADPSSLGEFDLAVAHGITTWIAPEVRSALFDLVGRVLRPGGVFYNSYNTLPGWLSQMPLQSLILQHQSLGKSGKQAIDSALETLMGIQAKMPSALVHYPDLPDRIKALQAKDPAYLVQEYNNHHWNPVFFSDMAGLLAARKLQHLGTATLLDAIDGLLPPAALETLAAQPTPALKEQIRDVLFNQSFRRDLYVKGRASNWPGRRADEISSTRLVLNVFAETIEADQSVQFKSGTMSFSGQGSQYAGILSDLREAGPDGLTFAELQQKVEPSRRESLGTLVTLLIHRGTVCIQTGWSPKIRARVRGLNAALAASAVQGAPYVSVVMGRASEVVGIRGLDWNFLSLNLAGVDPQDWPAVAQQQLLAIGRAPARDGQPLSDPAEQLQHMGLLAREFVAKRLPDLERMGVV